MSSQTVAECFSTLLPKSPSIKLYPPQNREGYRYLPKIVAESTLEHDPLAAYIKMEPTNLARLAKDALEHAMHKNPQALSAVMPTLERTHSLKGEADVLRLSIMQLLHPVNIVLEELIPRGCMLVCGSERIEGINSRFDILWLLCDENGAEEKIAVLEMKSTHVIHEKDFTPAEATTEAEWESKNAHAYTIDRRPDGPYTCLEENAIKPAWQAAKYSAHCKHVAVFDWTAMFLFDYRRMRDPSYGSDKAARGFFFTESSPRPNYLNFRRLLLAFVAEALNEALKAR
ncbi:hypothetical protein N7528_003537 [Penicillium herquei]|nr:hypothetical protein N7528_003537 [Penicillium herquei]